jgi:hypothetical protein
MMTQDETPLELPILNWSYRIHHKPGKPPVLRVTYGFELYPDACEWVPFESPHSFGQRKARHWWKARSHFPVPTTCDEALAIARQGGLAKPLLARVKIGGKYPEVVSVEVDRRPPMSVENVFSTPMALEAPRSFGLETEPF